MNRHSIFSYHYYHSMNYILLVYLNINLVLLSTFFWEIDGTSIDLIFIITQVLLTGMLEAKYNLSIERNSHRVSIMPSAVRHEINYLKLMGGIFITFFSILYLIINIIVEFLKDNNNQIQINNLIMSKGGLIITYNPIKVGFLDFNTKLIFTILLWVIAYFIVFVVEKKRSWYSISSLEKQLKNNKLLVAKIDYYIQCYQEKISSKYLLVYIIKYLYFNVRIKRMKKRKQKVLNTLKYTERYYKGYTLYGYNKK
ncbi:hypothetical protein ACMGE6_04765 [Macrococcus equi]|uniref:hypothetical protein n=1 Tax=Macrococcus equi TaxID=3395462 RepID=UPI0039BEC9E5